MNMQIYDLMLVTQTDAISPYVSFRMGKSNFYQAS